MSIYRDDQWRVDVAYLTPSVISSAPIGQATVRVMLSCGPCDHSFDVPAEAALALAKAIPECVEKTQAAFKAAYGDAATSVG